MFCQEVDPCSLKHCSCAKVKTHRELFADFFASLFGYPLEDLIAKGTPATGAQAMWAAMSRDIMTGGGKYSDPMSQVWVWPARGMMGYR